MKSETKRKPKTHTPYNGVMPVKLHKKLKQYAFDNDINQKDAILELIEKGLKKG